MLVFNGNIESNRNPSTGIGLNNTVLGKYVSEMRRGMLLSIQNRKYDKTFIAPMLFPILQPGNCVSSLAEF